MTDYPPGVPCWSVLGAANVTAARRFYGRVLDWEYAEERAGDDETACLVGGRPVAGIGAAGPGEPAGWRTVFRVADAAEALCEAVDAGGQAVSEPVTRPGRGVAAVARDPAGAAFGLWEARGHAGAALVNEHGAMAWHELPTCDLEQAAEFYATVFGYTYDAITTPGGAGYRVILVDGRPAGGILEVTGTWPAGLPTAWTTYFNVDDVDGAARLAARLGGAVAVGPFDAPFGRIAALRDPQGAAFSVILPAAA